MMPPDLSPSDDLARIAALTLADYERRADAFWAGTRDHDVRENIEALLRHLPRPGAATILDFGCGPGRDLHTFRALGHVAIGLEGLPRFAAMAREFSGCDVWEQDFLDPRLPVAQFDGIFANASLFHVPRKVLPGTLLTLRRALVPGGVLFASNPRGDDDEGWQRGRYGVFHSLDAWRAFVSGAGFVEIEHYYRPAGLPREAQPWLATVWRNPPDSA